MIDARDGMALPGARVWLFLDEEAFGVKETVSNGTFCFLTLPQNRYRLMAERPACERVEKSVELDGELAFVELILPCESQQIYVPFAYQTKPRP